MHGIPMFVFITSSKKNNQLEECLNCIKPLLQENYKIMTDREGAEVKALKNIGLEYIFCKVCSTVFVCSYYNYAYLFPVPFNKKHKSTPTKRKQFHDP